MTLHIQPSLTKEPLSEQQVVTMAVSAGLSPKAAGYVYDAARALAEGSGLRLDKCVVTIIAAEKAAASGGAKR